MFACRKSLSLLALPTLLLFFVFGCGFEPAGESALADRGLPDVLSARVVGSEMILIEFAEPASEIVAEPSAFVVRDAEANPMVVNDVVLTDDGMKATLTVGSLQQDADYVVSTIAGHIINFPVEDASPPRVVGAVSTSNTTVLITFSNMMGRGADDETNYFIVQETSSPEAGILKVLSAGFGTQKDTVVLTTLPQNEVTYTVRVVNVRDELNQHMAPPELLVDPSVATFRGTPPTCQFTCSTDGSSCTSDDDCDDDAPCDAGEADCENTCICSTQDTDGDGLPDHIEQRGWPVTVELTNRDGVFDRRSSQSRDVTSDPTNPDTDGDGLSDYIERELASDPRNPDTDGDGLSDEREFNLHFSNPIDQDSDEDQLDDLLEVTFYKTSPILEDTDGDGLNDDIEILELNRNARLADLPEWEIDVGDLLLQIDERYTFVDENGETVTEVSSTSSSFSEEDETSTLKFNSKVSRAGWELGGKLTISSSPSLEIEGKGFVNSDTMSGSDTTTTSSLQSAYEASLDKGREFTTTREVTREVFGASIDAPLTVRSTGDIAFSITNLELSVLQLGPDRESFVPVATLVPNAELLTGETTTLNIGPLLDERGPINLGTQEVFPSLVEGLMRAPQGPIIVPSNFDITDEFGRNFAFTSQEINDRTATIIVDLGDGRVEQYNVAIAGSIDNEDFIEDLDFVGGFDGDGLPNGIPLDYALQDIIGLTKEPNIPDFDSITAGPNGIVETVAAGDDIQVFTTATTGLSDITVIIDAGDNGILDTNFLNGDDEFAVTRGYATSTTCNEFTVQRITEPGDGEGDGLVNTVPEGDDIFASGITAFGDTVNPGDVIIQAGPNGIIDTVPSGDDILRGPGELCETNSDCPDRGRICVAGPNNGMACTVDLDCSGQPACIVPDLRCSNDLTESCTTDADCDLGTCSDVFGTCALSITTQCTQDSDCPIIQLPGQPPLQSTCNIISTICSEGSLFSVCEGDADCNGTCVTLAGQCNSNSANSGAECNADSECIPLPTAGTCVDSSADSCSGREVLSRYKDASTGERNRAWIVYSDENVPFGTSFGDIILKPRMTVFLGFEQDIDRDGLFARHELGFGSSDRDKDTDDDGISDAAEVRDGWIVDIAGTESYRAFPDPRTADSDGDGVSDSQEMTCGTDPRKRDSDDDGISDFDELNDDADGFAAECEFPAQNPPTHLDPLNPDTDGDGLLDGIEPELDADNLDPDDAGNFLDSDEDGLPDSIENIDGGWDVNVGECDNSCGFAFDGVCQEFGICQNNTPNAGQSCADDSDCAGTPTCEPPASGRCTDVGSVCFGDVNCDFGRCDIIMACSHNGSSCTNDDDCSGDATCLTSPINFCVDLPGLTCDTDADCVKTCEFEENTCNENSRDEGDTCTSDSDCRPFNNPCRTNCDEGTDCADCGALTLTSTEFSDPTRGDTDFDGLPDFLEQSIGSNPNNVDTDGDGLLDFDEFANFGQFFQNNFLFEGFFLTDAGSQQIGTSLTSQDTDGDGLTDSFELLTGWRVLDLTEGNPPRDVMSSPLFADSDFDGLTDSQEYVGADMIPPGANGDSGDSTDPTDPDTDGDGRTDFDERNSATNPLVPDLRVTVSIEEVFDLFGPSGDKDWDITFQVIRPNQNQSNVLLDDQDVCAALPLITCESLLCQNVARTSRDWFFIPVDESLTFTIPSGDPIVLEVKVQEVSSCASAEETTVSCFFNERRTLTTSDLFNTGGFTVIDIELDNNDNCSATFPVQIQVD